MAQQNIKNDHEWKPHKQKVKLLTSNSGRSFSCGYRRFCTALHAYYRDNKIPFQETDPLFENIRQYLKDINQHITAHFKIITWLSGYSKPKEPDYLSKETATLIIKFSMI